jgi:hypothetical protein
MAPTAAEEEPSYSVLLPETLSGNKWIVRRQVSRDGSQQPAGRG